MLRLSILMLFLLASFSLQASDLFTNVQVARIEKNKDGGTLLVAVTVDHEFLMGAFEKYHHQKLMKSCPKVKLPLTNLIKEKLVEASENAAKVKPWNYRLTDATRITKTGQTKSPLDDLYEVSVRRDFVKTRCIHKKGGYAMSERNLQLQKPWQESFYVKYKFREVPSYKDILDALYKEGLDVYTGRRNEHPGLLLDFTNDDSDQSNSPGAKSK